MTTEKVFTIFNKAGKLPHLAFDLEFWEKNLEKRYATETKLVAKLKAHAAGLSGKVDNNGPSLLMTTSYDPDELISQLTQETEALIVYKKVQEVTDETKRCLDAIKRLLNEKETLHQVKDARRAFSEAEKAYKQEAIRVHQMKERYHQARYMQEEIEIKLLLSPEKEKLESKLRRFSEEAQLSYRAYISALNQEYEKWRELFKTSQNYKMAWQKRARDSAAAIYDAFLITHKNDEEFGGGHPINIDLQVEDLTEYHKISDCTFEPYDPQNRIESLYSTRETHNHSPRENHVHWPSQNEDFKGKQLLRVFREYKKKFKNELSLKPGMTVVQLAKTSDGYIYGKTKTWFGKTKRGFFPEGFTDVIAHTEKQRPKSTPFVIEIYT